MDLNEESNSLIDWNAPAVEYTTKPLIPLPSLNDQIQISEDNPFDVMERQINENEMFDLFNLNLSFHADSDQGDSCKCGKLIDHTAEEMSSIKSNTSKDEIIKNSTDVTRYDNEDSVSECKMSSRNTSEPGKSTLDMSSIINLSSIAEVKEMIRNRLSRYTDEPSHQSPDAHTSSSQLSLSLSSISKYSSILNNGFILSKAEKVSKSIDVELTETVDDVEDIQSIMPNWDEFVLSSSDEELENYPVQSKSNLERSQCINKVKKLSSMSAGKTRVPLVLQDPNIRVKKTNSLSKQGPLKAVIPLSSMSKMEDRKASTLAERKHVASRTSKISTPLMEIKQKRKSAPIATSTPQNQGLLGGAKNSLNQVRSSPKTYSRPPSPDSTSTSRFSRINAGMKSSPKRISTKLASDVVSSSTNVSFPGASRLMKSNKKENLAETVAKNMIGGKPRTIRNKENVSPFRK